ncbi:MAG: energy-coupling factor transporter ATPase [Bacilli bacterium]
MGITIKGLSHHYKEEKQVLTNVDLTIKKGEWVSIVGHNGSGKSTLAKILCTLLEKRTGDVTVDGIKYQDDNLIEVRRKFGVVFQNPDNQFVGTTVFDDVAFGLANIGLPKDEIYYRVDKYLDIVGMSAFKKREPHTLSGGQKQRIAIASSLALEPEYLILDEATSMLDPNGKSDVTRLIKYIHSLQSTTIISITHNLEEAIMSDRIVALNKGNIVYDGSVEGLKDNIELFTNIGVLVPFSLKLSNDLRNRGVNIDLCTNVEELIAKLCQ